MAVARVRMRGVGLGLAVAWTVASGCTAEVDDGPGSFGPGGPQDTDPDSGGSSSSTGEPESSSGAIGVDGSGSSEGSSSTGSFEESSSGSSTGAIDPTKGQEESSSSSDDGSGPYDCTTAITCQQAVSLGSVSGDEGSPVLTTSGEEPTWITFHVTENNRSVAGEEVSFTVTLTSPPDVDFDLYVYRGPDGGNTGCNGTGASSVTEAVDSVHMEWGEGLVANGSDEDAWIAVEIRAKNGMCVPGAAWSLTADGDT
jgi:hypothetical protein